MMTLGKKDKSLIGKLRWMTLGNVSSVHFLFSSSCCYFFIFWGFWFLLLFLLPLVCQNRWDTRGESTHMFTYIFFSPCRFHYLHGFFFFFIKRGHVCLSVCFGCSVLSSWEKWSVVCLCVIFCHSVTGFLVVV